MNLFHDIRGLSPVAGVRVVRRVGDQILDKIDEWNTEIGIWSLGSPSREAVVFGLHGILFIPVAFVFIGIVVALLVFFGWLTGVLVGI